jgi:hypothetical protein
MESGDYERGVIEGLGMAARKMDSTAALYRAYARTDPDPERVKVMENAFATCTEAAKDIRTIIAAVQRSRAAAETTLR